MTDTIYHTSYSGLDWTGMDWNGLEWTGMDWNGLYLFFLSRNMSKPRNTRHVQSQCTREEEVVSSA